MWDKHFAVRSLSISVSDRRRYTLGQEAMLPVESVPLEGSKPNQTELDTSLIPRHSLLWLYIHREARS